MTLKPFSFLLLIASLAGGRAACADTIQFFNTGVDDTGALLSPGATDTHYTLIYNPDGITETSTAMTPNSVWLQNIGNAGWIGPVASGDQDVSAGNYVYEAILDLTGYDPTTATLSGSFAADNSVSIYLNRGGPALFAVSDFTQFSNFTITTGFTSGINLVDFLVHNDGGPSGLVVSNTIATASPVPEPAALLLVGTGIIALYAGRRMLAQS